MTLIPYSRQVVNEIDIQAVLDVLRSDFLTQGPIVPQFEQALSDFTGACHAVTVNSATSALHISCLALNLKPGDILWTSPITFVASANCGRYCGATIDFVDIDPNTFNMSADALEKKLKLAEETGKLPKIIVVVHMCGQSPDMKRIAKLAQAYKIRIIEDASHAIGASYLGKPIGSGAHSDITVFSFHPVKIITTGEGGAAITNDARLAARMKRLRSHGITRDQKLMDNEPDGPWYYEQVELGWNYRMTDMQAALGLSQIKQIGDFVRRRREIADLYDLTLSDLPIDLPYRLPDAKSAWHLYVIRLRDQNIHRKAFEDLLANDIGVNLHYIPVHLQPYYRALGFKHGDFPIAEDYYSRAISIPLFAGLTDSEQRQVIHAVSKALT